MAFSKARRLGDLVTNVDGNLTATEDIQLGADGFSELNINSTRTTGNIGGTKFRTNGTVKGSIFGTTDGQIVTTVNGEVLEAMRVKADGKVGIGTTDPSDELEVDGTVKATKLIASTKIGSGASITPANFFHAKADADGSGITIQRDSTTVGTYAQLSFINTTTDNYTPPTWIRTLRDSGGVNTSPMTFGTAGTEQMRIDSSGVIQMPQQPSFMAIYPAATTGNSNNVIIFGGEQHDEGGNYNQTNGRFTAPVAGKYFFTCSILFDPNNTGNSHYCRLAFGINGTTSALYGDSLNTAFGTDAGSSTTVSSYQSVSMSTNLNLAEGDYVTVHNAGTMPTYGTGYGSFGGFLIG